MPDSTSEQRSTEAAFTRLVAIGASAGGLEALQSFLQACSPKTGCCFVIIQHLSPDHKSMMSDLLARHTHMSVAVVQPGMKPRPDAVFLIPPGKILELLPEGFVLQDSAPNRLNLPIDAFLTSAAHCLGDKVVALILSGTGSDGTRGAQSVNMHGGIVLVQSPDQAKFDGMPVSAIASGVADEVMSTQSMAQRIAKWSTSADVAREAELPSSQAVLRQIFKLMENQVQIDFSEYKPATSARRIERRMRVLKLNSLEALLEKLKESDEQVRILCREMLISVTAFFRDHEAFDALSSALSEDEKIWENPEMRVWVAGCSSGEEAYSILMLLDRIRQQKRSQTEIKLFATDVHKALIERASSGVYPESSTQNIPQDMIDEYFVPHERGHKVSKAMRNSVIFACHNLLSDPPFTRINLICCRNTLIYMEAEAQKRVLARMQYSLREGGLLFLGTSEAVGGDMSAFDAVDTRHKIYRRNGDVENGFTMYERHRAHRTSGISVGMSSVQGRQRAVPIAQATEWLNVHHRAPALLVTQDMRVVHIFGDANQVLNVKEGHLDTKVLSLLPEELISVTSVLLGKVFKGREMCEAQPVEWVDKQSGQRLCARLHAGPISDGTGPNFGLLAVAFTTPDMPADDKPPSTREEELKKELAETRDSLRMTIEELETTNEELQAANEELMAANEELQSANEELLSVNEELNVVNGEYQQQVLHLNQLNADLGSMTSSVGVAILCLDHEINVTRFSPEATELFHLREADLGRHLGEVVHKLHYGQLMDDLRRTILSRRVLEKNVMSADGRYWLVRLTPYSVPSSHQVGIVATFVDMTASHKARDLQSVIDGLPEHIAVLDDQGTIVMVNHAWSQFARVNGDPDLGATGVGVNYLEALKGKDADSEIHTAWLGIKGVLEGSQALYSQQYPCHSPEQQRWFLMSVAPLSCSPYAAVVSHFNISPWMMKECAQ